MMRSNFRSIQRGAFKERPDRVKVVIFKPERIQVHEQRLVDKDACQHQRLAQDDR
jgi:hypothetical protein